MAKKNYRLLQQAVDAGADFVGDKQPGDEFEHDFYNQASGINSEQAVIAAGWVEPVEDKSAKADAPKGGKK